MNTRRLLLPLVAFSLCFKPAFLHAANRIWDGGGTDDLWLTAANWVGDVAPVAGDDLIFSSNTLRQNNTNNLAAGTTFNSVKLTRAGYNLYGSNFAVNAFISMLDFSGTCTVNPVVTLNANQTFTNANAPASLGFNAIDTNGKLLALNAIGEI